MQSALLTAEPRRLAGAELAAAMRDSRAVTLARTFDLPAWPVPQQAGVNRIDWELGHLAWFAEFWILRGPHAPSADGRFVEAARPARIAGPDAVFDSSRLAHPDRWRTAMPSREALAARLEAQLEACIDAIPATVDDAALYWHRLVLLHEDMHGEAFAWLRATLGWPAPPGLAAVPALDATAAPLRIDAADIQIGRPVNEPGFAFDNERPGLVVGIAAFEIDAHPITNGDFLAFVEAGGYERADFWPGDAGRWLAAAPRSHPQCWSRRESGEWQARWFDRTEPLALDAPLLHVNAFEAEAWCLWRGRRLPSAAEWVLAARDLRFRWGGSVWEWMADVFAPFPGFEAGPYRDYSAPWFGNHRELKGGSFATHPRLHDARYRNFFTPERSGRVRRVSNGRRKDEQLVAANAWQGGTMSGGRSFAAFLSVLAASAQAAVMAIHWDASQRFDSRFSVGPKAVVELCGRLPAATRVKWQFKGSSEADFNVHSHQGKNVVYAAKKDEISDAEGTLDVPGEQGLLLDVDEQDGGADIRGAADVENALSARIGDHRDPPSLLELP